MDDPPSPALAAKAATGVAGPGDAASGPNGHHAAMPGEQATVLPMHETAQHLNPRGAKPYLTLAQQGLVGDGRWLIDVTDAVILLRRVTARGRVPCAPLVAKERTGAHWETFRTAPGWIRVGDPPRSSRASCPACQR